jgi:hypothetical protein
VHKEALANLGVKLWESTNGAGVNSRVKHTRARKHSHNMIFLEVSLAKHKVFFGGVFLWAKQATIFFYYWLEAKCTK